MFRRAVTGVLARSGYELIRRPSRPDMLGGYPDLEPEFVELYRQCAPYTMTSTERMYAVYQAVKHVTAAGIEGDVVECGVWLGGSSMLAAATLLQAGDVERDVWLYDTFEGMPPPGSRDVEHTGMRIGDVWEEYGVRPDAPMRCLGPLERVRANMMSVGLPPSRTHFVVGHVEETIPAEAPDRIAVLRLDTDWFESTRHELVHLYPRLSPGGVLIIDDYGHWLGAREAVDGYLREQGITLLLNRIDYTGRMAVKPASARS